MKQFVNRYGHALNCGTQSRVSYTVKRQVQYGQKPLKPDLMCRPPYLKRLPLHPSCVTVDSKALLDSMTEAFERLGWDKAEKLLSYSGRYCVFRTWDDGREMIIGYTDRVYRALAYSRAFGAEVRDGALD